MQIRYIVKSKKQNNGIFGTPMQLVRLEGLPFPDSSGTFALHSAICVMAAELHPKRLFETLWHSPDGFTLHFLDPIDYWKSPKEAAPSWFRFNYDEWHLIGQTVFQNYKPQEQRDKIIEEAIKGLQQDLRNWQARRLYEKYR